MNALRRTKDIVVHEIEGEVLLYDLKTDKAYCLNRTSAAVWNLCDGSRTNEVISDLLEKEGVSGSSPELVEFALYQLKSEGLLADAEEDPVHAFDRRELARRAGITAVAALPFITSLVVPMPAAAQSGACGPTAGQTCTCSDKVRNFGIPCPSSTCTGGCACTPPFVNCNGGGHFCQGTCV